MNGFKKANASLTHTQIINEYEDKVRALERDNERLRANNDKLHWKIEKTKQAQLELCRDVQGELR